MKKEIRHRNIGITGFMSGDELQILQTIFSRLFERYSPFNGAKTEPRLMAGILASSKTIAGFGNKYPGRYPKREDLANLFSAANADNTLNLCHYNTDSPENLVAECGQVVKFAGPDLHGFQLNVCWPEKSIIRELRHLYPDLYFLLQIGASALSQFARGREGAFSHYDTRSFVHKVKDYEGYIDEVLLDPSGGKGELLEAGRLEPLVKALMQIKGLGIGVAGGLSAKTLGIVYTLSQICSYLSIDAEGQLRHKEDDSLNISEATSYLKSAFCMLYPR